MIPASFDYVRARDLHQVWSELDRAGDEAKLLAGGQSLLPLMKLRLARPSVLVDVERVDGLAEISLDDDDLRLGALARHAEVGRSPVVARAAPLLAHVAGRIGDRQVRHRGTIGGAAAHADPASDLAAALLALDARMVVASSAGTREVDAADFFVGYFETVVGPTEMLTEIRVPRADGWGWGSHKLARRSQDWAIVAAVVQQRDSGPRIAVANMAPVPWRAHAAESAWAAGDRPGAGARAADDSDPPSDIHGSAAYRRHLATVLVSRALADAEERR